MSTNQDATSQGSDPHGFCSSSSDFGGLLTFTYYTRVSKGYSSPVLPPSQSQAL
jgi:hypothetical protein